MTEEVSTAGLAVIVKCRAPFAPGLDLQHPLCIRSAVIMKGHGHSIMVLHIHQTLDLQRSLQPD